MIGSSQTIRIDTRVLAATNRNLLDMVDEGTFREDLYYRLNVFPILVPPLRERTEDIPTLVRFFLTKHAERLGKRIEHIPKLGNSRPSSLLVDRQCPRTRKRHREGDDSHVRRLTTTPSTAILPIRKSRTSSQFCASFSFRRRGRTHSRRLGSHERRYRRCSNGAAKILDMNPNTLRSRMEKHGIKVQR